VTVHAPGLSPAWGWLDSDAIRRLELRFEAALRRARATGTPALVSVTAAVDPTVDATAVVVGSRRPGEAWFCLEQPDRDGSALAGLGCVQALDARGPGRFEYVARRWADIAADAFADDLDGPPGSGLVALGGFAFAADGGASGRWEGFAPASMIVPEVSLARRAQRVALTVNAEVAPDDTV
jgi:salicylate biosynthesis isochorismate synthase